MARLQIEISEELNGWLTDEIERRGTNKTTLVASILEAAKAGGQTESATAMDTQPEPAAPRSDADTQRKILVTLEMFLKRYLKNDPPRRLDEAERESLEERWEAFLDMRNAELAK